MAPVRKSPADRFDDENYPAYTTGRAAEMIGATPAFLHSIENTHLELNEHQPQHSLLNH